MLFYQIGEFFQEKAVGKFRNAIKALVGIKAEYATLENGEKIAPEDVCIGDIIVVRAGEKVALDGIVLEGSSFLDMSVLKIKITKEYDDCTIAKVLELVENSTAKKSKVESFISKFAKIYTPIVVIIALFSAVVPPLFFWS